jgi:hypothetical protein
MAHWTSLATAERRDAILRATSDHDDGWRQPDAAPTVDLATGSVADFVAVPAAVKQGVWPRAVAGLADSPWAAALVGHHAITVYDRFRGDPGWASFFAQMERVRAQQMALTTGTTEMLIRDYVYVRLGDLTSLAFCNAWTEPQVLGPWSIRLSDARHLLVEPNPFVYDVPIEVEARALPPGPYASDAALQAVWRAASTFTITGVVVGRTRPS